MGLARDLVVLKRVNTSHAPHLPTAALRRLAVVLAVLVALLVIIRIVLDPIAAHYTHKALNGGEGFRGTFASVHVSIMPPGFEMRRLKIIEHPGGNWDNPMFYVEKARLSILWRQLLRGHLVANTWADHPKVLLRTNEEEKSGKKAKRISEVLEEKLPVRVDRLDVDHGELLVARGTGDKAPTLWIHDADLVAENLATRKALMEGEAARLALTGRVQRSGKLGAHFTMDPWAKGLTFSGRASLRDLDLRELWAFTSEKTDLQASQGTIDLFADIRARNGVLSGGVKPVLKDVELKSVSRDLGKRIKAALADAAIHIVANEDHGQERVATVIPIKGTVSDPHAQLLPTVLGAIRNAFVEGLAGGFADVPPPTSDEKEGALKQAWKALKKGEGPPEAQPERPAHAGRKAPR
jgi:hypothetical protein